MLIVQTQIRGVLKICSKTFDKRSWLLNKRTEFQCHKHLLIKSADLSTLQHWPDLYFRPLIRFHILFKICNAYNQYKICTVYLAYRNVNHEGENIVIWYVWILMVLLFMTNSVTILSIICLLHQGPCRSLRVCLVYQFELIRKILI